MAGSLDEVKAIIEKNKAKLAGRYGIRRIGIFGSFVRDEQHRRSDIDILVEFEEVPGLLRFVHIEEHLRRLLGRKVDLVRQEALRPELRERILKEAVYI
ncbi:MAG TPA: nucleotidyltransferase family protein [Syntrophorhabdaceae bacterium]|jgi:hypothetical protein